MFSVSILYRFGDTINDSRMIHELLKGSNRVWVTRVKKKYRNLFISLKGEQKGLCQKLEEEKVPLKRFDSTVGQTCNW